MASPEVNGRGKSSSHDHAKTYLVPITSVIVPATVTGTSFPLDGDSVVGLVETVIQAGLGPQSPMGSRESHGTLCHHRRTSRSGRDC
jgi:hypothetical protein